MSLGHAAVPGTSPRGPTGQTPRWSRDPRKGSRRCCPASSPRSCPRNRSRCLRDHCRYGGISSPPVKHRRRGSGGAGPGWTSSWSGTPRSSRHRTPRSTLPDERNDSAERVIRFLCRQAHPSGRPQCVETKQVESTQHDVRNATPQRETERERGGYGLEASNTSCGASRAGS